MIHTKETLLAQHGGKEGYWEVRTPPDRDERGFTSHIMYCKGKFEAVLSKALKLRDFRDDYWVGEINPIMIEVVE